jgi:predicted secreted protein
MAKKTYPADAGAIEASVGDVFVIEVEGQPGAGYQWQVTASGNVRLVDRNKNPSSNIGGASREALTFECVDAGPGDIHLQLKRPWESKAAEAHQLTVRVK